MTHRHHTRSHFERVLFANPHYVRSLQEELQELGFYKQTAAGEPLKIDGIAGEETRKALQEWAGLQGDDIDGVLGSKSLHAIYEKLHTPPQDALARTLRRKLRRAYASVRQEHAEQHHAATPPIVSPHPSAPDRRALVNPIIPDAQSVGPSGFHEPSEAVLQEYAGPHGDTRRLRACLDMIADAEGTSRVRGSDRQLSRSRSQANSSLGKSAGSPLRSPKWSRMGGFR